MERFLNNLEDSLAEEQGFSTVGVALALLLSFALIFSAARVYEIESVSGDIQNVADSAALAAENVVGEYCVIATMCDAVVLSLSLSSPLQLWDFRVAAPARHPPPPYRKHSSKAHRSSSKCAIHSRKRPPQHSKSSSSCSHS